MCFVALEMRMTDFAPSLLSAPHPVRTVRKREAGHLVAGPAKRMRLTALGPRGAPSARAAGPGAGDDRASLSVCVTLRRRSWHFTHVVVFDPEPRCPSCSLRR